MPDIHDDAPEQVASCHYERLCKPDRQVPDQCR